MANSLTEMTKLLESSENHSTAMALAMGEVTRSLERVAARLDKTDEKLDDIHVRVIKMEEAATTTLAKENRVRIENLEKEITTWKTRIITIASIITVFWAVFGDVVHSYVGAVI